MYAVVHTGGKQVRVAPKDVVDVEKLKTPVGEQVTVPAGAFGCVRVEERWEEAVSGGDPIVHVIKSWYARGVGLVKDETWEDEAKTSMIELTAYTTL